MVKSRNWLAAYATLSILDAWMTLTLLPCLEIGERNPVAARAIELVGLSPAIYGFGLLQIAALAIFIIYSGKYSKRIEMLLRLAMLILLTVVASNNFVLFIGTMLRGG